ncbi:MAG: hypothetical protein JNL32_09270 [Candidatus Kapabacteria bacterium]|nr:hypothetical protein [Candidatus Kapabacteria bacterium]
MKTTAFVPVLILAGILLGSAASQPSRFGSRNPVISLDRSGCFGKCPTYTITFTGDGKAVYKGVENVERIGYYTATISREQLRFLCNEFAKARFFSMKNIYDDKVTDIPTYTVKYRLNGRTKTVIDRYDPPKQLRALEATIDSLGNTLAWKKTSDLK